jgi:tetratricopeptide (TPR) repeat protein
MKTALLLLLALLLACGSQIERQGAARLRFEQALAEQNVAAALEAVEDLRDALPEAPESTLQIARLLARVGEMNEALWLLEEAIERHPEHRDLQLGLAETALQVGDGVRALAVLEDFSPRDPEHPYVMLLRSRAELSLGELEAALFTLEQAVEQHPDRIELRIARIEALIQEKLLSQALEAVREARSLDDLPDAQRSWFELTEAHVLAASGEVDTALSALEELTTKQPGNLQAWKQRITILFEQGEAAAACELISSALEAHPELTDLYVLLANAQLARGDEEAAESVLRELVERAPGPGSAMDLAQHLHNLGRSAEGAALMRETAERYPDQISVQAAYLHVAMLLSAEQLEQARRAFDDFERRYRGNTYVDYLRARFELVDGDAAAASQRLKRVASRLDRADVQHWLGVALETLRDYEAAEYRYGLAIGRNSSQIASYLGLLRVLERRGDWGAIAQYATALVQVAPQRQESFEYLSRAHFARGAPKQAENVSRLYAERFPGLPWPAVALSGALRQQGRLDEALVVIDEAAGRFATEPTVVAERVVVLALLARGDEALRVVGLALADAPGSAPLHRSRAYLLFKAGRAREATEAVGEALRLAPEDPAPLQMLGDYLSMEREFAGARDAYERYLALRPADAEILFRLGVALSQLGELQPAVESYQQAIAVDENMVKARNNLALVLERQGHLDEALAAAQAAYARAESEPVVMDTLGWLYLRKGLSERAVALLEKAREAAPEAVETRYHLALAYRDSGRAAEARELLSQLHESLDASHELHDRVEEAAASLR